MSDQATANLELRELFKDFDVQAISKPIYPHPSTAAKAGDHHYCFVDLKTVGDAERAVATLNGQDAPRGSTYRVSIAQHRPKKLAREQLGGSWPEQPRRSPVMQRSPVKEDWNFLESEDAGY